MTYTSKPNGCVNFLLVVFCLFLSYFIVVFLAKVFVFSGYNFFFFTDNLLAIKGFNPVINWTIFGLLLGSIAGVIIAVKKFQLSKLLILYPAAITAIYIIAMWLFNNPAAYTVYYKPTSPTPVMDTVSAPVRRIYYKTLSSINARSGPSPGDNKLFTLKKKAEVEMIKRRFFDSKNAEWFKIKYNGKEGFVNSKYLIFSRTSEP